MNDSRREHNYGAEAHLSSGRRRLVVGLLRTSFAASLAAIFYPILKFVLPPKLAEPESDTVVAALKDELAPNAAKVFSFGVRPAILIRLPSGDYRAFSAVCTHLQCTVQYRSEQHDIWCACHNGVYDLNGRVVSGPPPRPLEEFAVHLRGDKLVVSRRHAS